MAKFLIESPHTEEECLKALDELVLKDPQLLDNYEFGCKAGEHTAYLTVDASSEEEACMLIPDTMKENAKVVRLNKFTPDEIQSFHQSG